MIEITPEVEAALEWAETPDAKALALRVKAVTAGIPAYDAAAQAVLEESA